MIPSLLLNLAATVALTAADRRTPHRDPPLLRLTEDSGASSSTPRYYEDPIRTSCYPFPLNETSFITNYNAADNYCNENVKPDLFISLFVKVAIAVNVCKANGGIDPQIHESDGAGTLYQVDDLENNTSEHEAEKRTLYGNDLKIFKCCKKGEQLDARMSRCVPRVGYNVENIREESLFGADSKPQDLYWIPMSTNILNGINVTLRYNDGSSFLLSGPLYFLKIKGEKQFQFRIIEKKPYIFLEFGDTSIAVDPLNECYKKNYCFDAVEDGLFAPHVLVKDVCVGCCNTKCCFPDEILSEDGLCVKNSNISQVSYRNYSNNLFVSLLPAPCIQNQYLTTAYDNTDLPPENLFYLQGNDIQAKCVDWQRTAAGGVRKVLGTCSLVSNVGLYEGVRPLGLASVALLVAAAVATLVRGESRASVHGLALACHALSLAAANVLQVGTYFASDASRACCSLRVVSFFTYFFLVAGNFWLCVITLNMMFRFSQPLGALAAARTTERATVRRRFLLASLAAWGFPCALTAACYAIWANQRDLQWKLFATPTFEETRVCPLLRPIQFLRPSDRNRYAAYALEVDRSSFGGRKESEDGSIPKGPLVYYYVPIGILVIVNLSCVIMVVWKMRKLKDGNAALSSNNTGNATSRFKSALVYVKLLLMAGLVEGALEVSSWALRPQSGFAFSVDGQPLLQNAYTLLIAVTFVDLVRSAAVLWLCVKRPDRVPNACNPEVWWGYLREIAGRLKRNQGEDIVMATVENARTRN